MENIFFDLRSLKYLGVGARVGKTVRIRKPESVIIGDNCIIDDFTYISCSLELGKCCHIGPNVTLSGGASQITIGDYVGIGAGSSINPYSSEYSTASFDLASIPEEFRFGGIVGEIKINNHVLLGSHTIVLPKVTLPEGLATAALTVLRMKKYDPWTLYGGFEGREICKRNHSMLDSHLNKFPNL